MHCSHLDTSWFEEWTLSFYFVDYCYCDRVCRNNIPKKHKDLEHSVQCEFQVLRFLEIPVLMFPPPSRLCFHHHVEQLILFVF